MPILNHVHKYVRWKKRFYRCTHADCTHYAERSFLIGKRAVCNLCGESFILSPEDLRRSKPRCINCSDTKEAKTRRALMDMLDSIVVDDKATAVGSGDPNHDLGNTGE
jgi:hypothetical protein